MIYTISKFLNWKFFFVYDLNVTLPYTNLLTFRKTIFVLLEQWNVLLCDQKAIELLKEYPHVDPQPLIVVWLPINMTGWIFASSENQICVAQRENVTCLYLFPRDLSVWHISSELHIHKCGPVNYEGIYFKGKNKWFLQSKRLAYLWISFYYKKNKYNFYKIETIRMSLWIFLN